MLNYCKKTFRCLFFCAPLYFIMSSIILYIDIIVPMYIMTMLIFLNIYHAVFCHLSLDVILCEQCGALSETGEITNRAPWIHCSFQNISLFLCCVCVMLPSQRASGLCLHFFSFFLTDMEKSEWRISPELVCLNK